jgi:glutathione S-transferase
MPDLYGHPFAAFVWKVLITLYDRDVPFRFRIVDPEHPDNASVVGEASPGGQFPVLVDGARAIIESAAIIEYLDLHHGDAPPMVPRDPRAAIEARQMDSVFDDYVAQPMQRIVADALREERARDPHGVAEARAALDRSYGWLDRWMQDRDWAGSGAFGLADCAAAPALFYADWVHPVPEARTALRAYRARLLARPSIARVVDEARPYRPLFPLGAPDRD